MDKLTGLILIFVGCCGFVYSWAVFPGKTFRRLDTIQASKQIYEGAIVKGLRNADVYVADLPNAGFVKTGSWVKDLSFVIVKSPNGDEKQPFEVKIGDTEIKSKLHDNNFFYTVVIVSKQEANHAQNIIKINKDEDQIFLKINDEVAAENLKLKVIVGTGYSLEQLKTLKIEELEESRCIPF